MLTSFVGDEFSIAADERRVAMDIELYKSVRNYILMLLEIKKANLDPKDLSQLLKELRLLH